MKRMIKAARTYQQSATRSLSYLSSLADILSRVAVASSPEELQSALSSSGHFLEVLDNKEQAIKALVDNIDYIASDYLIAMKKSQAAPKVEKELVDFLKGLGYEMKPITPPRGWNKSYRILSIDEAESSDLDDVCRAVIKEFAPTGDGTVLGGSWTSHGYTLDGISFKIGFEEDIDADPTRRERSLQLVLPG